jgi:hypothetical protein
MRLSWNRLSWFLLLAAVALSTRLGVWYAHHERPHSYLDADTISYLEPGRKLLGDGTFPSFMRTPVYPLFLGLLDHVAPDSPRTWALIQVMISWGIISAVGYLAGRVFGGSAAIGAMLFLAADWTSAIAANLLMSETLFAFLLLICLTGVWYAWQRIDTPVRVYVLVGLPFGVLTLCRPIGVLLFVVVGGWFLATRQQRTTIGLVGLVAFCMAACAAPAAWVVRNRLHTGEYFLSTIVATNLYEYRAAWNVARLNNGPFDEVKASFESRVRDQREQAGMNPGQLAKWEMTEGLEILSEHPLLTLRQGFDGFLKMYLGISISGINSMASHLQQHGMADTKSLLSSGGQQFVDRAFPWWITAIKVWAVVFLLVLYTAVFWACGSAFGKERPVEQRQFTWLLVLVVAYFTFFSVGAETYSRFRVPIAPLLCMLAGVGCGELGRLLRCKPTVSNSMAPADAVSSCGRIDE